MNDESTRDELRIRQFDKEFPRMNQREYWLTMYLELREDGDSHSTASETIKAAAALQGRLGWLSL